jgi:tRNA nucleotidyltransferase/poly(A) polymerase
MFSDLCLKLAVLFCAEAGAYPLRKSAQKRELHPVSLDPKEEQIFNLLRKVIADKSPDTILRVAGGWVRDKLLGKTSHDIDIAINNMSGEQFANLVVQYMGEHGISHKGGVSVVKANPQQSKHLATAMVNVLGVPIDFVNLRKETYAESRIPTVEPGTPEEDASRRDLTINSLFYNINTGQVEDFVGGIQDLENGVARTPLDPVQTFLDDPLRILRTIRFASKYNLQLAPEVIEAAKAPEVQEAFRNKISPERIWKEMAGQEEPEGWKAGFMTGPDPVRAARLLGEVGLRDVLFGLSPEEMQQLGIEKGMTSFDVEQKNPHHDLTIWEHTLSVLKQLVESETTPQQKEQAEEYLVRNLSALLHDVGKCDICSRQEIPEGYSYHGHEESSAKIAEYVLRRLKAPNSVVDKVVRLVRNHMRLHLLPEAASDKALRKFVRDLEDDWRHSIDLAIADAYGKQMAQGDPQVRAKYDEYAKRINEMIQQMGGQTTAKAPITGRDLINIGFKPGPLIGQALRALQERLLEAPDMGKEEALQFIAALGLV